jgi:hypothetical protein
MNIAMLMVRRGPYSHHRSGITRYPYHSLIDQPLVTGDSTIKYPLRDSNPHALRQPGLSRSCLPFLPRGQEGGRTLVLADLESFGCRQCGRRESNPLPPVSKTGMQTVTLHPLSGWQDLNLRPLASQTRALPDCATPCGAPATFYSDEGMYY